MDRVETIQYLLDEGRRIAYIANYLGEHHEVTRRTIKKEKLEIYTAFDEENPQLTKSFDDWDYEDILDSWDRRAWQGGIVLLPRSSERDDVFTHGLIKHIKDTYGGGTWVGRSARPLFGKLPRHLRQMPEAVAYQPIRK